MRCPDCKKEIGTNSSCPFCGATIGNSPLEETDNYISETKTNIPTKPLISTGIFAFGIAAICTVIWFFITLSLCKLMMGELVSDTLAYAFKSKVFVALVMGIVTALTLSFSNNLSFLTDKTKQISITIILALVSFAVTASVGGNINNVPNVSTPYYMQCARTLNLSVGIGIPLLVGSLFITATNGERKNAIRNTAIISIIYLVLAIALVYLFINVFAMGLTSIAFVLIAAIIAFIISVLMKKGYAK